MYLSYVYMYFNVQSGCLFPRRDVLGNQISNILKKFYLFWKINPDLKFPFMTISYQILLAQHMFDLINWLSYLLNKILSLVQNLANATLPISSIFDQTSKYWMYVSFTIVSSFHLKSSLKYISKLLFKTTNTIYKRL